MSWRHYDQSLSIISGEKIEHDKVDFYSIIMAAMRRADTDNLGALCASFPKQWEELLVRYNAPGGFVSKAEAKTFSKIPQDAIDNMLFPMEGWPYV